MFKNFLIGIFFKIKTHFYFDNKNGFDYLYGSEDKEPETELDYNLNVKKLKHSFPCGRLKWK
jgi:hypothetical protein